MSLIEITPGSEAKSQTLNDNFDYLEELVVNYSQTFESRIASANNNISNITSNMATMQNNIVPIGAIIWHSKVPLGYLRCDGSLVSRTEYSNLFTAIGVKFGAGDGSTTFALPQLTDNRFIEGYDSAGTYKNAGLPNITGNIYTSTVNSTGNADGAFARTAWEGGTNESWGGTGNKFNLDATRSSSIYGASSTVQPKSLTLIPCIKY